jgi:hypothetical protein
MADATVLEQDRSRLIARLERRLNRARSARRELKSGPWPPENANAFARMESFSSPYWEPFDVE